MSSFWSSVSLAMFNGHAWRMLGEALDRAVECIPWVLLVPMRTVMEHNCSADMFAPPAPTVITRLHH